MGLRQRQQLPDPDEFCMAFRGPEETGLGRVSRREISINETMSLLFGSVNEISIA